MYKVITDLHEIEAAENKMVKAVLKEATEKRNPKLGVPGGGWSEERFTTHQKTISG